MKYEMIFGDPSQFEGMMPDCEFVDGNYGYKNNGDIFYYCERYNEKFGWTFSHKTNLEFRPIAMRRIIKEPAISGDIDDLIKDEFSEWWEKEGCLVRSGGGDRERTFAFAAFRKLMPEILAARRLKKTPVWTVADQRAGRLPEVGVFAAYNIAKGKTATEITSCWREGDELEIMKDLDEGLYSVFNKRTGTCSNLVIDCIKPIESPEEKAARLRSEWCIKALSSCSILSEMQKYELKRLGGYIEDIYDALLSGDLPVPVKE